MLGVGGVQAEQGCLDFFALLNRHVGMHRPVVVEVRRCCEKHVDILRVDLVFGHKLLPNRDV